LRREQKLVASGAEVDLVSKKVVSEKHLIVSHTPPVRPVAGLNPNRFHFFGEPVN
jgi:hypothetical protein